MIFSLSRTATRETISDARVNVAELILEEMIARAERELDVMAETILDDLDPNADVLFELTISAREFDEEEPF